MLRDEDGWLVLFGGLLVAIALATHCAGCAAGPAPEPLTCAERCELEAACDAGVDAGWCRVRCEFWRDDVAEIGCALEAARFEECIARDACGWRQGCAAFAVEYSECVDDGCAERPIRGLCERR